jgi:hypothetical protein
MARPPATGRQTRAGRRGRPFDLLPAIVLVARRRERVLEVAERQLVERPIEEALICTHITPTRARSGLASRLALGRCTDGVSLSVRSSMQTSPSRIPSVDLTFLASTAFDEA